MGGTDLEVRGLEGPIRAHFHPNASADRIQRIFKGDSEWQPLLGDFASKIDIAYALGILSEEAAQDFHSIRTIRSSFAHATFRLSFRDKEVSGLIDHLRMKIGDDKTSYLLKLGLLTRQFIVGVMSLYYFLLVTYSPGLGPIYASIRTPEQQ